MNNTSTIIKKGNSNPAIRPTGWAGHFRAFHPVYEDTLTIRRRLRRLYSRVGRSVGFAKWLNENSLTRAYRG